MVRPMGAISEKKADPGKVGFNGADEGCSSGN